jgi:electron transfer flavoprotein beta subunit
MMRILCPIKRVVDPYAKVQALSDGSGIDAAGAKYDINPFDEIALEEAVQIRERLGSAEIIAVSIGQAESEDQLRKALAMGADRAILITIDGSTDSLGIAKLLKGVVEELSPDLVLMGKQATDDDNNQAAQMLAGMLGWPQATFASKIEIAPNSAIVTRETDEGEEILEVKLPAVATADLRLNQPRYIALPAIMKARNKPLEKRVGAATAPRTKTVRYDAPPPRQAGVKVGSVEELISKLKSLGALA